MKYRTKIWMLSCTTPMNWAQQRSSFGRMVGKGFTLDEAKKQSPICSKCVTMIADLKARGFAWPR